MEKIDRDTYKAMYHLIKGPIWIFAKVHMVLKFLINLEKAYNKEGQHKIC